MKTAETSSQFVKDVVYTEKKEIFERILTSQRRFARTVAIQALFLHDFNLNLEGASPQDKGLFDDAEELPEVTASNLCHNVLYFYDNDLVEKDNLEQHKTGKMLDEKFLNGLVLYAIQHLEDIDKVLSAYLNERWPVDKLDPVVRSILRCAVAEIMVNTKTDIPILTSEYTNAAGTFFGGREIDFVNGVLDRVSKAIRKKSNNT